MVKLLVDTCVWLDLAKSPDQIALLSVVEELIKQHEIEIVVPQTVIDEFDRNKERVIKESTQSLSGVFRRVKEVMTKFGDPAVSKDVVEHLNNVNKKLPLLGESVAFSIARVEKIIKTPTVTPINNEVLLRAAQRAVDKKAPFHRHKNSMNDAILIEVYSSIINSKGTGRDRFAFITHNKADFSTVSGNEKEPHSDFAQYFSKRRSLYFLGLAEALHRFKPELVSDIMLEYEWDDELRPFSELTEMEQELTLKIWYNRHQVRADMIKAGRITLVDTYSPDNSYRTIVKEIWSGALKAAKTVEKEYGKANLGPYTDFEWGMLSGKLSAIRWVMGDEWDNLDT